MNIQKLHQAVLALYKNATAVHGDSIDSLRALDKEEKDIAIDKNAVLNWQDPDAYKIARAREYPPIGDQLDALWKGGAEAEAMLAKVQAIKNKYPKGV